MKHKYDISELEGESDILCVIASLLLWGAIVALLLWCAFA